ncbi:putative NBD/HSP70 family sugar kinase [Saccharopolyspora phatthalungensis]|uniref:Putative NBD/HSP70 family sugar kinase n=1 Tax=Saccharopolyspora phatthalungensis TaxID=664693 RepID=A0A840QJL9_9PSEU|nr:putative NBD/HSP70 family sugar kinase [Saccharopolyspora phatthalungensis]
MPLEFPEHPVSAIAAAVTTAPAARTVRRVRKRAISAPSMSDFVQVGQSVRINVHYDFQVHNYEFEKRNGRCQADLMPSNNVWLRDTPGALIPLFREHRDGLTKSETMRLTGLSRTAVSQRIDALVEAGYLTSGSTTAGDVRGRPAERFTMHVRRGVLLVADTGATEVRTALCDPLGAVLEEQCGPLDITEGPEQILSLIAARFDDLLQRAGVAHDRVLRIGLSLPGPVDHDRQRVVRPPIMTGWDDYDIAERLARDFACPVTVEKDANAMALGEYRQVYPHTPALVFVKIGTGVGTGLIIHGDIYRGADGAAGDIGHVPLHGQPTDKAPQCRCGNDGCVEAYAGGWALARDLSAAGFPARSVNEFIDHVRSGNRMALQLVKQAATIVGTAVSDIVNMVNPRIVVFGGQLAELDDILLATARNVIYGRSLPLATRNLRIAATTLSAPGVHGLAQLLADQVNSAAAVDAILTKTAPRE